MEYYIVGAFVALIAIALISSFRKAKRERKDHLEFSEMLDRKMFELREETVKERRLHILERKIDDMEDQLDNLGKVQLLTLDHLSLEHQIQPEKDVLVKKTKERG